jgi:hypothetical protein
MGKVIRLTESDLEMIVRKVLNEQNTINSFVTPALFQNINTKNLKIGDGGRKSPEKRNDVIALQQILINSGNLKTKTGKPTGYFGNLTNAALNSYNQSKSSAKGQKAKVVTKPEKETSFTDNVKNFCLSAKGKIKAIANQFDLQSIYSRPLPPHMRAFLEFLGNRTTPINANFFKPQELKIIEDRINSYFPKDKKCVSNKACNVQFYTNETDWGKIKSGDAKVFNPELGTALGYTIGNGYVVDNGNSYTIKDIYDFNNYVQHPEAYSLEKMGSTAATALKKIFCGNYIQGLEELASFKQAMGYKGIPVEIEIPKKS